MILIADGGSTKCDWVLLDEDCNVVLRTRTLGLNPMVVIPSELDSRIRSNEELTSVFKKVAKLDFYGAGCGTPSPRNIFKGILEQIFPAATVTVNEDVAAAVYAATTEPGIVCILGTGSNSCYYDGKEIHMAVDFVGLCLNGRSQWKLLW